MVNGSGDGFLANIGSACRSPERIAITLGTSASVRCVVSTPALDPLAGAFCYRASRDTFLLGCAGSNGGNVLEWARSIFGPAPTGAHPPGDLPIFLPWLNAERSLEWNPELRAAWHGLTSRNSAMDLSRSVMEGVVFNLAQYVEVIERLSGRAAQQVVLSGNGFLDPAAAPLIAALVPSEVRQPRSPGLASLRGAAVCAWRALGRDPSAAMERIVEEAVPIAPLSIDRPRARYAEFKKLRARL